MLRVFLFSLLGLSLTHCASIRVVKSKPGKGGVIAIKRGFIGESAEDLADKAMSRNCKRGYQVVEEGEVVIGSSSATSGRQRNRGSAFAAKSESRSSSRTETVDKTEWRMTYKCKGGRR